jgi:hypothetical protein
MYINRKKMMLYKKRIKMMRDILKDLEEIKPFVEKSVRHLPESDATYIKVILGRCIDSIEISERIDSKIFEAD